MTDVTRNARTPGPVVPRAPNGRWLPGAVPNPAGGPPGVRARYAEAFLRDSWRAQPTTQAAPR
jgi:hypothetical protein